MGGDRQGVGGQVGRGGGGVGGQGGGLVLRGSSPP